MTVIKIVTLTTFDRSACYEEKKRNEWRRGEERKSGERNGKARQKEEEEEEKSPRIPVNSSEVELTWLVVWCRGGGGRG